MIIFDTCYCVGSRRHLEGEMVVVSKHGCKESWDSFQGLQGGQTAGGVVGGDVDCGGGSRGSGGSWDSLAGMSGGVAVVVVVVASLYWGESGRWLRWWTGGGENQYRKVMKKG